MDDSIDRVTFSVRIYLPLIKKDTVTHMHGHEVYVKEGLPFSRDISLKNSENSCVFDCCLIRRLTSFTSIDHHLFLFERFLMLFHPT